MLRSYCVLLLLGPAGFPSLLDTTVPKVTSLTLALGLCTSTFSKWHTPSGIPRYLYEMPIPKPQLGPSEFNYLKEASAALCLSFPRDSNALTLENRLPSSDLKWQA